MMSKSLRLITFKGFGREALVAICGLMILGEGLEKTGSLKPLARMLSQYWSKAPATTFLITLLLSAVLSVFVKYSSSRTNLTH